MADPPFTDEDINSAARANAYLFALIGMAYAKAVGRDPSDWVQFAGRLEAVNTSPGSTPLQAAAAVALSTATCNLHLVSLTGDAQRAEVVMADAANRAAYLRLTGLSPAEADTLHDIFQPIAAAAALTYSWHREGEQVHFIFTQ